MLGLFFFSLQRDFCIVLYYEKAMDSVEFWRKFYREQYDKTWDKNPEQANEYLGIAIALGDTLRDMKRIAEG